MAYGEGQQKLNNISRKRAFADMLRKQGQELSSQLGQTQMVSGRAVPNSGWGSANAIISQLLGAYMGKKAGEQTPEAKAIQMQELQDWASALQTAGMEREEAPDTQLAASGANYDALAPEQQQQVQEFNQITAGVQPEMPWKTDEAGKPIRDQNAYMAEILRGAEIGGLAEKIAQQQFAKQFMPTDPVSVGRGAALVNPNTGEEVYRNPFVEGGDASGWKQLPSVPGIFYNQAGEMAKRDNNGQLVLVSSEEAQKISAGMRQATSGSDDVYGLAQELAMDPEWKDKSLNERLDYAAKLLNTGEFGAVPVDGGIQPTSGSALSQAYIKDGTITPYGASILGIKRDGTITSTGLLNPDKQKEVYGAAANSSSVIDDVNLLRRVIQTEGGWLGGALFGNENMQKLFGWADNLGIGMENTSEVKAAIRRLQLKGKIDLISQAGGVRAFDSDREMQNLVESLTNEEMDAPTMLQSLDILEQRARENLENFDTVKGFINDTGNQFIYGDVEAADSYSPPAKEVPGGDGWIYQFDEQGNQIGQRKDPNYRR